MNPRVALPFFLFVLISFAASFDITSILAPYSDYSVFNGYLSQTNLVYQINARKTITILVVDNGAMSALSNLPLDSVKKALSLHVILDYYDIEKLQELSQRSTILTTLYQTTGVAEYSEGFVNVTLTSNGRVEFGSAIKGAGLTSELVKTIAAQPYDISVLQVSSVIIPPALKYMAPPVQMNITTLLLNAGFKVFVGLLQSTGALSTYQSTASSGVTIFAPKDQALASLPVNLTSDQKASLMLYHGVTGYLPVESLSKVTAPLGTLASNGNSKFQLVVKTNGQSVALSTGLNIVNVVKTVIDQQQVIVYAIDGLLRAPEIFSPGSVPVPTPKIAPLLTSPPPNAEAPAPSDDALAPSNDASPPSPPSAVAPAADGPAADTPAVSPSAGTAEAPADAKTKDASSATRLGFGSCFAAVLCTLCYMNM